MSTGEIRIARRVAIYMLERAQQARANRSTIKQFTCPTCGTEAPLIDVDINTERDLAFFQGLGLALAVIYEEVTARTAADKKPQEIIEWAKNLPDVRYRKVDPR